MEEKRQHKRLELSVQIQLERIEEGGVTTVKFFNVDVTDISRTGIGFTAAKELEIGTYYDTKIMIWTKETIDSVIEIVRREELADGKFKYGCVFIGLQDTDALKIDIYQIFNEL